MNELIKKTEHKKIRQSLRAGLFSVAPRRQFRRLVAVFLIILTLVVLFHMYLFNQLHSQNIFQRTQAAHSNAPVVNEKKLIDVLSRYDAKIKARTELQMNTMVVSDPSR